MWNLVRQSVRRASSGSGFVGASLPRSPSALKQWRSALTRPSSRAYHAEPIPPELFNQPPTQVTTLPNGLRIATQRTPDETVTVAVFVDSGSRYETKENNGVAHFLEHMVFKGTQRRTRIQLEKEIEDMGAHLNAYTAREQTVYYAKSFKKDLAQAVDILADILTHSKCDPSAIEEERHVILREMEEVEKSSEEVIFDRLHMTAYRDNSLGFTILGPPENVRTITRDHILDYIHENYTADRLVIAGAGDLDHKQLVQLAEKHFSGHRRASAASSIVVKKEKPEFTGSQLVQRYDALGPFAHLAMGYQSVSWTHPAQPVFMVMQSIIGVYDRGNEGLIPGTISGNRTKNNVANREMVGCAENFAAFNTCYKDTGLFGFYIRANQNAMYHAMEELQFSVCCLAYSVTEEEVQTAKHSLKLSLFGNLDTTTAICEDIGRQMLVYGRRIPAAELYKRIEMIDADEVRRVAWEHLYDQMVARTAGASGSSGSHGGSGGSATAISLTPSPSQENSVPMATAKDQDRCLPSVPSVKLTGVDLSGSRNPRSNSPHRNPNSNPNSNKPSPMYSRRGGRDKEIGAAPRRRRSLHGLNAKQPDDYKLSESRSSTPSKTRRDNNDASGFSSPNPQGGDKRPTNPSSSYVDQWSGEKERTSSETSVKLNERNNGGFKTRGGSGRRHEGDATGSRYHLAPESHSRPRSSSGQSAHSHNNHNNHHNNYQNERSRGLRHSDEEEVKSNGSSEPRGRNTNNNNGNMGMDSRSTNGTQSCSGHPSSVGVSSSSHQNSPSSSSKPLVTLRYTVEELHRLRYAPASNRRPCSGLHSMIDRNKPLLVLCPRRVATSQYPPGPTNRTRKLEPWSGRPSLGTVSRRESECSANEATDNRHDPTNHHNPNKSNNKPGDSSSSSSSSTGQEFKRPGPSGPSALEPSASDLVSLSNGSQPQCVLEAEEHPQEEEYHADHGNNHGNNNNSQRVGPTTKDGYGSGPSASSSNLNNPSGNSAGSSFDCPSIATSTSTIVQKSSMGSADVPPFIPRNHIMNHLVNNQQGKGIDVPIGNMQQQSSSDPRNHHQSDSRSGSINGYMPMYAGIPHTSPTTAPVLYPMHQSHVRQPHQPYDNLPYNSTTGNSPGRRSQQHVELQNDPAISSYGFGLSNPRNAGGMMNRQLDPYHHQGGHGMGHPLYGGGGATGYDIDGGGNTGGIDESQESASHFRQDPYPKNLGHGPKDDLWDAPIQGTNDIFTLGELPGGDHQSDFKSRGVNNTLAEYDQAQSSSNDMAIRSNNNNMAMNFNSRFQQQASPPVANEHHNPFTDNLGSEFFEEEDEEGHGNNGGSTFMKNIFSRSRGPIGNNTSSVNPSHQQQQQQQPYMQQYLPPQHATQPPQPSYPNAATSSLNNLMGMQQQAQQNNQQQRAGTSPSMMRIGGGATASQQQFQTQQELLPQQQHQLNGNATTQQQQQQQLRVKLEAWAKSKGHASLTELIAYQQRQQRPNQQQSAPILRAPPTGLPDSRSTVSQAPPQAHPHLPNFPFQQQYGHPAAAGTPAMNALLQILQRHNLSSEQALNLARVLQTHPQLVESLLDSLRIQQQRQQQQQQQGTQQPGVSMQQQQSQQQQQQRPNQPGQPEELFELVRQKLLAAQQAKGASGVPNLPPHQTSMPQQQSQVPYNNLAVLQQMIQQQFSQQGGAQLNSAAALSVAKRVLAARAATGAPSGAPWPQERQQQQQVNSPSFPEQPTMGQQQHAQEIQGLIQQLQSHQSNPQLQQLLHRQVQQTLQNHQGQQQQQYQDPINHANNANIPVQNVQYLISRLLHKHSELNSSSSASQLSAIRSNLAAQLANLPPAAQQQLLASHILTLRRQQQQQTQRQAAGPQQVQQAHGHAPFSTDGHGSTLFPETIAGHDHHAAHAVSSDIPSNTVLSQPASAEAKDVESDVSASRVSQQSVEGLSQTALSVDHHNCSSLIRVNSSDRTIKNESTVATTASISSEQLQSDATNPSNNNLHPSLLGSSSNSNNSGATAVLFNPFNLSTGDQQQSGS